MIVTYADGRWSDNLAIERYEIDFAEAPPSLTIEVAPRERIGKVRLARQALREFIARRRKVDTIQIAKPLLRSQLRKGLKKLEIAEIGVKLAARGHAVAYPAAVVVGPDAVTLNLG